MQRQGFLEYLAMKCVYACLIVLMFFLMVHTAGAATIKSYSDTISTSAPGASANHTINFTTLATIPVNGYIRFTPDDGDFDIPGVNFDFNNVALYVATSSGYQLRASAASQSADEDGIAIVSGSSGNIEITLNATVEIPADAKVRMLIGNHASEAASTTASIINPPAIGSYTYRIGTGSGSGSESTGLVAIVDQVTVGDVNTRETDPPFRFNGAPSGNIAGNARIVQISFETNELAVCRFAYASNTPFYSMGSEFSTQYSIIHSKNVAVASSTTYDFFIRCIDDEGNINIDDYVIHFVVLAPPPGVPGPPGDDLGQGSGSGSGTGDADPGTGSSSGDTSGNGSSGGGGSGGTGGTGDEQGSGPGGGAGFETVAKPYQSGDGEVIITGYAFPKSTIVALVDGKVAQSVTSDSNGSFSVTLSAIARGAYTFGVYGVDKDNVKSSTFSTTFTVTGSRATTLSNINVMPSLKVTPDPVDPGSTLTVTGYAIPNATITIENQNDKSSVSLKTFTATSDNNGFWKTELSTAGFLKGTYKVRAKAKQEAGVTTNFSNYTYYGVGEAAAVPRTSDLNRDSKVNLTDFSILLFWWGSDGGASNPPADINRDGKVSLTDFSIMIFNWTG